MAISRPRPRLGDLSLHSDAPFEFATRCVVSMTVHPSPFAMVPRGRQRLRGHASWPSGLPRFAALRAGVAKMANAEVPQTSGRKSLRVRIPPPVRTAPLHWGRRLPIFQPLAGPPRLPLAALMGAVAKRHGSRLFLPDGPRPGHRQRLHRLPANLRRAYTADTWEVTAVPFRRTRRPGSRPSSSPLRSALASLHSAQHDSSLGSVLLAGRSHGHGS